MDQSTTNQNYVGTSHITYLAWGKFKKEWAKIIPVFLIPILYQCFNFYIFINEYFSPEMEKYKISFQFDYLIDVVLGGALTIGIYATSLAIVRGSEYSWLMVFSGFKRFFRSFFAYLIYGIIVILFTFLLIIPGIIMALSCSMMFFILAEDQDIDIFEALSKSRKIMIGNKWRLFKIFLFFIFLMILSLFTLGLGLLVVAPWYYLTLAAFYEEIKDPLTTTSELNTSEIV